MAPHTAQKRKMPDSGRSNPRRSKKQKNAGEQEFIKKLNISLQQYHDKKNQCKKLKKDSSQEGKAKFLEAQSKADETIQNIYNQMKGKLLVLARKRPGSGLIQKILKFCKDEKIQRDIYDELAPNMRELAGNIYAVHIVLYFLKIRHLRPLVVEFVSKNAPAMLVVQESCRVVDEVFGGKSAERRLTLRSFFGSERHDEEFAEKINEELTFDQLSITNYCAQHPDKAVHVSKRLAKVVSKAINKELLTPFQVLHYLTNEALNLATPDKTRFLVSDILEQLVHIVHTPYGRDIAVKCVYFGRKKERKVILKNFKDFAVQGAVESNAFQVMCALMDVTDDTRKTFSSLLKPLLMEVSSVLKDAHGSRVLLFPFAACDTRFFSPDQINNIRPKNLRDDLYNKDSKEYDVHKKPKEDIQRELAEKIYTPLLAEFAADSVELLQKGYPADVLTALFEYSGPSSETQKSQDFKQRILENILPALKGEEGLLKHQKVQKMLARILNHAEYSKFMVDDLHKYVMALSESKLKQQVFSQNVLSWLVPLLRKREVYQDISPRLNSFKKELDEAVKDHSAKTFSLRLLHKVLENPRFEDEQD